MSASALLLGAVVIGIVLGLVFSGSDRPCARWGTYTQFIYVPEGDSFIVVPTQQPYCMEFAK